MLVVELGFDFSFPRGRGGGTPSLSQETRRAAVFHRSPVDEGVFSLGYLRGKTVRVGVLGEVGGVSGAANLGDEGRGELLLAELEPVEVLEPAVVLDVVGAVAQAPVPLGHICHQQVLHQTFRIPTNLK